MFEAGRHERSPAAVLQYLRGIVFPADRNALIRHARRQDANDQILELLDHIPNRDYGSMADVMKGVDGSRSRHL
jgi:hypothetical protein